MTFHSFPLIMNLLLCASIKLNYQYSNLNILYVTNYPLLTAAYPDSVRKKFEEALKREKARENGIKVVQEDDKHIWLLIILRRDTKKGTKKPISIVLFKQ